jgi:hypothetical protein
VRTSEGHSPCGRHSIPGMTDERVLGEKGHSEALQRLRDRLNDPGMGDPLISLAEVLEWSYTLDEYHAKQLGANYRKTIRAASDDGETQAALTFARGLFTHSLTHVGELVMMQTIRPAGYPGGRRAGNIRIVAVPKGYHWKLRAELPPPDPGLVKGRDLLYDNRVAGRPLLDPLEAAARFLRSV